MRKILTIVAFALLIIALFKLGKYVFDYNRLSDYGQGYIWGNAALVVVSAVTFLGLKYSKKKEES